MSKEGEIISRRKVNYAKPDVYRAWTNPQLLAQWWGPKGFTNTFRQFNLHAGGEWEFTMHSPQGADFHNKCIFQEVVPNERLVFDHVEPVHAFTVTATFKDMGNQTLISFSMLFKSAKEYERSRKLIEPSNEENFDRLEAVLADHFKSKV